MVTTPVEIVDDIIKKNESTSLWVIREESELEKLKEDIENLLSFQEKLKSRDYDDAKTHAKRTFLKEIKHEDRKVSRFERRVDYFCKELIRAFNNLAELAPLLTGSNTVETFKSKIKRIDLHRKLLIDALSRGGKLQQSIEEENWNSVKSLTTSAINKLNGTLIILKELEEMEDLQKKQLLLHKNQLHQEEFSVDLKIAKFLTDFINKTFYSRGKKDRVLLQGIFNDIQHAKTQGSVGGYIAHHVQFHPRNVFVKGREFSCSVINLFFDEVVSSTYIYQKNRDLFGARQHPFMDYSEEDFNSSEKKLYLFKETLRWLISHEIGRMFFREKDEDGKGLYIIQARMMELYQKMCRKYLGLKL
jgi:hypothetical protein